MLGAGGEKKREAVGWGTLGCPTAWEGDRSDLRGATGVRVCWPRHQPRPLRLSPAHPILPAARQGVPGCLGPRRQLAGKGGAALTPPWAPWLGCCRLRGPQAHRDISAVPQDPNWYKAKNKVGREGIIPANYVQKREGVKAGIKLSLMP